MGLEDDWDEIVSDVRKSYPDRKIEEREDTVEVSFDPSTFLTLKKNGFVEGSMPKHHFESSKADKVNVRDGITVIRGENFEYLFKET